MKATSRAVNTFVLSISAMLAMASLIIVRRHATPENEFLIGVMLGALAVSVLPWMVVLRRWIFKGIPGPSRRWNTATIVVLILALVVGPLVTGPYYLWLSLAHSIDGQVGAGPVIWLIVVALVSHFLGLGLYVVGFLIQLCRDRWYRYLNGMSLLYQLLMFILYCRINT